MAENKQQPPVKNKDPRDMFDANKAATDNVASLLKTTDTLVEGVKQRQGPGNVLVEKYQNVYRAPIKHVVDTGRSLIATEVNANETPVAEQIQSAMQPVSSSATPEYKVKFFDAQTDKTSKNATETSEIPTIPGPGNSSRSGG